MSARSARASGVPNRCTVWPMMTAHTGDLSDFHPVLEHDRRLPTPVRRYAIRELLPVYRHHSRRRSKISRKARSPSPVQRRPAQGAKFSPRVEQPRGECHLLYQAETAPRTSSASVIRTPTNCRYLAGPDVKMLQGCDLADVAEYHPDHRPLHQLHGKVVAWADSNLGR